MMEGKYNDIVKHYELCFEEFGANHKGMDWPNEEDLIKRFEVMLGVIRKVDEKISLLDFGCGVGLLYDYIRNNNRNNIEYSGVDMSLRMVQHASLSYPGIDFKCLDIIKNPLENPSFDYIVMNGVLTEKVELSQEEMLEYAKKLLKIVFASAKKGIAFNVMSSHVDWQRKDLFHWELDDLVSFLVKECSRKIVIRMDYELYEYTVYVYKSDVIL